MVPPPTVVSLEHGQNPKKLKNMPFCYLYYLELFSLKDFKVPKVGGRFPKSRLAVLVALPTKRNIVLKI